MTVPSAYNMRTLPTIPPKQSIYEESSTQEAQIGQKICVGEREFVYASAGANLSAGDVVATPASLNLLKQTAGGATIAGTRVVNVYMATSAGANAFADGYLTVNDGDGQGYCYKVKQHAAIGDTSTGTVTLYDPVAVAIAATSDITLTPNKYSGVTNVIGATTPVVGVAPVAVTSGNYCWLQVSGPAAIKVNTTVAYGSVLTPATTGGATLVGATQAAVQPIGLALAAGTTGDNVAALLSINPA